MAPVAPFLPLIFVGILVGQSAAQDTASIPNVRGLEDPVAARQEAMRENARIVRSAIGGDDPVSVADAELVVENIAEFPRLFAARSSSSDSRALPIIWEQWEDFRGILRDGQLGAQQMLASVETRDNLAYRDALAALSRTCTECHEIYRAD
jgi:cytochrome c556